MRWEMQFFPQLVDGALAVIGFRIVGGGPAVAGRQIGMAERMLGAGKPVFPPGRPRSAGAPSPAWPENDPAPPAVGPGIQARSSPPAMPPRHGPSPRSADGGWRVGRPAPSSCPGGADGEESGFHTTRRMAGRDRRADPRAVRARGHRFLSAGASGGARTPGRDGRGDPAAPARSPGRLRPAAVPGGSVRCREGGGPGNAPQLPLGRAPEALPDHPVQAFDVRPLIKRVGKRAQQAPLIDR